jgi:photosystem II stability/assembly factor-like uncharacterized protein
VAVDSDGTAFAYDFGKLSQSTDGGLTWSPLTTTGLPAGADLLCIGLNPGDPGRIWLGTEAGALVLHPGATVWTALAALGVEVEAFAFDAVQPTTVYAATSGSGIWRSLDGGEHWEPASGGLTIPDVQDVVAHPRLGGVAFAVADGMVFRTTDGGTSWSPLASPPTRIRDLAADPDGHTLYGATRARGVLALTQSAAPVLTGAPAITGEPRVRAALHADAGSWDGVPAPAFAYEWLRCKRNLSRCKTIPNATTSDYRLAKKDGGKRIRLRVTASNPIGQATAETAPTDVVKRRQRR